jgi:hypothetical protein
MAVTASPLVTGLSGVIVHDTDVDENVVKNIANGACYLHAIVVDNTVGGAGLVHLKLYDNANPTVGGTDPVLILPVQASEIVCFQFAIYDSNGDYESGLPYTVGLSYACVQEAGTAGTTAPGTAVKIYVRVTPAVA